MPSRPQTGHANTVIAFQLVPLHLNYTNAVERAIATYKYHLITVFRKHLSTALATAHEHLCQQRGNFRSTKITTTPSIDNKRLEMTMLPVPITEPRVRTKMEFLKFI